jgi:toxin ParE1/3/4
MGRVYRTQRARVDLLQIWNYIAERNFDAANGVLDRILAMLNLIAAQPLMGEAIDRVKPGARRYSVGNYVIYFEPVEDGIRLLPVVHAARQVDDLLD